MFGRNKNNEKFNLTIVPVRDQIFDNENSSPNSTLPIIQRLRKKNLTTIDEIPISSPDITNIPIIQNSKSQKPTSSALLRMKEMFQFKTKNKETESSQLDKQKRFNEIAKMMKGNHDIYFKKKGKYNFSSDFKMHYESQYNKQKSQVKPEYFLDVVEFSELEKAKAYYDNFLCFHIRKKIILWKTYSSVFCQFLTEHTLFKAFSMILIWVNSLIFAMNKLDIIGDYLDSEFYDIIIVVFFIEILLKIFAQGFKYFKGWVNGLDFLIVFLAFILNFIPKTKQDELDILSSMIIIRPLTTIVNITTFQLIANAIYSAIPLLKESFMILLFFMVIFTISGLHLFSGYLKKRCFAKETGLISFNSHLCEDDTYCEFEGFPSDYFICGKNMENPNWGLTSFDTFFYAFLVVFQTCTLAGWNDIMVEVQETFSVYCAIYFVLIVIIGALILLNLILAVLKMKFSEYKEKWLENKKNDETGKIKRYSFQKLKKIKIFIGNQGKKTLLMGKSKSVLSKIKGIVKFKQNKHKLLDIINKNNPKLITEINDNKLKLTENAKSNPNSSRKKIGEEINQKLKTSEIIIHNKRSPGSESKTNTKYPFRKKKSMKSDTFLFPIPNMKKSIHILKSPLKFLPIKMNNPHNLNLPSHMLTLSSDTPLITNDPDELFEQHVSELFQVLDPKSPDILLKSEQDPYLELQSLISSTKKKKKSKIFPELSHQNLDTSTPLITLDDLEKDVHKELEPIVTKTSYPIHIKNNEEIVKKVFSPMKNKVFPYHQETINDRLAFPRLSHGFSYVKENQKLEVIEEKMKNEKAMNENEEFFKNNEETTINADFELEYDDPELPILKSLNPKHLKLEPNSKPYESTTNIYDILLDNKLSKLKSRIIDETQKPPKIGYALNYSKKFYKQHFEVLNRYFTKERNLTRLLLAGQTIKKLNKMKLPLFLSLDIEILKKQLKNEGASVSPRSPRDFKKKPEPESYFFRIQNVIHKEQGFQTNSKKTLRKSHKETLNLTTMMSLKDRDLKEIKKQYFGESDFMKINVSEDEKSSSDEEEVEKVIETAILDQNQTQHSTSNKMNSTTLMLNLKLEHILKTKKEELEEIDEHKRNRIYKKAKIKQEFNFPEKYKKILEDDKKRLENQKIEGLPQVFWSGEDVFGYSQEFYRYSSEGIHIVTRLRKLLQSINYSIQNYDIWEAGYIGKLNSIRKNTRYLVNSSVFVRLMLILVFINTIVLSLNGIIDLNDDEASRVATMNTVFTLIFTVEVILKLIGLGIIGYFRDKFNIFDCFIVIISLIEWIVLEGNRTSFSAFRAFSFFRTIRILRVSRLLRGLKYANVLAEKIIDSLQNCLKIALILIIFLYIYALMGMAIYQGKFVFEEIRQDFESFPNALIIVFQLITISNWNIILFGCLRTPISKIFSMMYLSSAVFIGNYLLLNLLLAILLDVFATDSSSELKFLLEAQEIGEDLNEEKEKKILETLASNNLHNNTVKEEEQKNTANFKRFLHKFTTNFKNIGEGASNNITGGSSDVEEPIESFERSGCNYTYYYFSRFNKLRILCFEILKLKVFKIICELFISISLIHLIIYIYVYESNDYNDSMKIASLVLEILINSFFFIEFLIQTINKGCLMHWNDRWGRLNTIIMIYSILILIIEQSNSLFSFQNYIRPFRITVVLRAFSYNDKYRSMASALLQSIKAIMNLVVMILLIWLMFSIIGVNFLQDKMGYCDIKNPLNVNRGTCEQTLNKDWKINHYNFDNVLNGLLTLFVLSFFEGFPSIVYQFVDGGSQDTGPIRDNYQYIMIFFIAFAVVSALFLMNLFICVIFMNYIMAEKKEKTHFLTEEQYRWIAIQRLLVKETPDYSYIKRPDSKMRLFFYNLTKHKYFEIFIFLCIIFNTVVMAIYYEGCPLVYNNLLKQINLGFTIIFIVEASLKLIALGFGGYFYSGWNKLDFFVVLTSIFDIWFELINENDYHISLQIIRGLRILKVTRLLRLIKSYSGLQKLFLTSVYSLPYVINAFAILFLVYFMFTILSVFLFRDINEGEIIDEKWVNFSSFTNALLNLLRLMAGEGWSELMYDTMNHSSSCIPGKSCGNSSNFLFFVAFIIIVRLIMFNIFVLIVLQQYEENYISTDNPLQHYNKDINTFKEKWVHNTFKQHGLRLNQTDIIRFFLNLPPPLGFDFFSRNPHLLKFSKEAREKILLKLKKNAAISIMNMNLYSDNKGYLYFNEVLYACIKRAYYEDLYENSSSFGLAILKLEEEKNKKKISKMKQKLITYEKSPSLPYKEEKKPINPLLGLIMATICFKSWMKFEGIMKEKKRISNINTFNNEDDDEDEDEDEVESEDSNSGSDDESNKSDSQQELI